MVSWVSFSAFSVSALFWKTCCSLHFTVKPAYQNSGFHFRWFMLWFGPHYTCQNQNWLAWRISRPLSEELCWSKECLQFEIISILNCPFWWYISKFILEFKQTKHTQLALEVAPVTIFTVPIDLKHLIAKLIRNLWSKGLFILYHNCVAVLIYWLLSAASHHSITAFQVKMNLTFMRHSNPVALQFLCSRVQWGNATQLQRSMNQPLVMYFHEGFSW